VRLLDALSDTERAALDRLLAKPQVRAGELGRDQG
jgi:hypothetical protein